MYIADFVFRREGVAAMPIINTFSANGKLISSVNEPLNEFNIERFIEQDEERAKIYLEALEEFTTALEAMVYEKWPSGALVSNSQYMVRKQATTFYHHNSTVLDLSKLILEKRSFKKPDLS